MAFSGTYRGVRFRSLLELSTIRNLEEAGLQLGTTMLYEATRIPYGRDGKRTYVVDLTLPQMSVLLEIKPSRRVDNKNNRAKRLAAQKWCLENGWEYLIVTEEELSQLDAVLTLDEVSKLPDVTLNERGLRMIRRKNRLSRRKKRKL